MAALRILRIGGTPTIVPGVPVCYAHSSYGILAYADYELAVKLVLVIIEDLHMKQVHMF